MALGSNQPATEMSIRNLPGGKEQPARMADNLISICELGRAIAQVVSCRLPTAAVRVQTRVWSCGIL
jgi:hypothetical protein